MTPDRHHHDDNTPTVAEWAAVILGDTGPWSIMTHDAEGRPVTRWATTHDEITDLAAGATRNMWIGMAARTHITAGRGKADDCRDTHCLWVDIDVAGPGHTEAKRYPANDRVAAELLAAWPLPPTSVLHSGGGLQAFWALAEPLPTADATPLLERWGQWWTDAALTRGVEIDAVWDITRVMRLPGTLNTKLEHPRPVRHLAWRPHLRYGTDDIDQWLPELRVADTPRHLAPVVGYLGPERPGDAFSAQHTCSEVLARNGWTLHHVDRRTGDEHWTRPGKQRREGSSATVYAADGRCVTWTDAVPGLTPRSSLTPFQLLTKLEHAGDFGASTRALVAAGYGGPRATITLDALGPPPPDPPDDAVDPDDPTMGILIDWATFWSHDHKDEEWLAEPIIPARRSVSIHAPGGTGKSLLSLHIAATLATGRSCLGRPPRAPVHVLYLDYEMTADDLSERLETMGYGPDVDMSHLHYALLPALRPLDTDAGGLQVLQIARAVGAELVVVDTYARAVEGDENEADTVRAFYRHTGSRIKAAGIALVRIDHTGKDPEKGARGSSAKRDDIDVAWRLEPLEGGPRLRAEKRRMSWVPETVDLEMVDGDDVLTYRIRVGAQPGWPAGTRELVLDLERLGVPADASTRAAQAALQAAGLARKRAKVVAACRFRREGGVLIDAPSPVDNLGTTSPNGAGTTRGTTHFDNDDIDDGYRGNRNANTQVTDLEPIAEPTGTTEPATYACGGVPNREPPPQGPPSIDPIDLLFGTEQ